MLAKFPPALLLTGTRAFDPSAVVETHRELIMSGVEAQLHTRDSMGHCFFCDPDFAESRQAYAVIVRFVLQHLQ